VSKRTVNKQVRLTLAEDLLLDYLAEQRHCDTSTLLRQLIVEEARRLPPAEQAARS